MPEPLGVQLSEDLRRLRRRLTEYLEAESEAGRSVTMLRGGNGGLHPTIR